jgi:hypothetical protein
MEYPFLICKKADYPSLRNRATEAPWSAIILQAHKLLTERQYDPQQSVTARGIQIRDIAGAAALLHLINPDDDTYLQRIIELLDAWPAYLEDIDRQWNAPGNRWLATVPPSSGFFNTVLALDLIHDDLSFADLDRHEETLQAVADWFWEIDRGWAMATYGPRAVWAAYKDESRLFEALSQYRNAVFEQMTADGVGRNGPEYSHARLNGERTAKYGFMHVAEHTGLDPVYYDSPQLARFYEWLFSAACSPFNSYVTFADSGHGRAFASFYPQSGAWAAGRFSPLAAEYAAHRITSSTPPSPGDLLAYCIAQPLPAGKIPQSRIWTDGGALFYEQNDSQDALMGALWNVETPGHHHRDANAIYLAGYGEHLLLNSGYNGYGNAAEGFPWAYINDTAESSNTLTIGDQNHLCQGADGVTESLLSDRLNYVSARADRAFPDDTAHDRSFLFVHPQDGAGGYFLLCDEISTDEDAHLFLHPASHDVTCNDPNCAYTWNVKHRKPTDTFLTLFLATPPAATQLKDGALAGWNKSFVGKYLHATYAGDPDKRLLTLLFPHDADHPQATLSRLSAPSCTGATIDHGNDIADHALESSGTTPITVGDTTLHGRFSVYRQNAGNLDFYFVRQGRSFSSTTLRIGFESSTPITIYMEGTEGRIISSGAMITLHHPLLSHIRINDWEVTPEETGDGWARFSILAGTHDISLSG